MTEAFYIEIEGVRERISYGTTGASDEIDAFAQMIQGSSDRVSPEMATFDLSSMQFVISNVDEMAELFTSQSFAPAVLDAPVDIGDTVISLDVATYQVGQVLYIGNEAVRVIVAGGGGTYQVVRGEYGTREADHPLGTSVWTRVPAWRGRLVTLYSYREGSSLRRWIGFIESKGTNETGTQITLTAQNLWTAALRTRVNRNSPRSISANAVLHHSDGDPERPILRGGGYVEPTYRPGKRFFYAQFDGALVAMDTGGNDPLSDGTVRVSFTSAALMGSELESAADVGLGGTIRSGLKPLFVVSKLADDEWIRSSEYGVRVGGFEQFPSSLGYFGAVFPRHPLMVAAYLLTGVRFNDFGSGLEISYDDPNAWSLGLRDIFSDDFATDVYALMEQDADLEIDHFILGWDDKEIDVLKVISQQLLRPFGYFFGVSVQGLPTIKRYRLPTVVDDVLDIEPLPSPWVGQINSSLEMAVEVVSATVGKLPWSDGQSVNVTARDSDANRTRLGDDGKWTLDYSTISTTNVNRVTEDLVRLSVLGSFATPRFRCRVNDPADGTSLGLGDLVRVASIPALEGYFVGPDGVRFRGTLDAQGQEQGLTSVEWLYGIIVERAWDPAKWTYDLTVLLTSYRTGLLRLRGGSAVVTGVTDNGANRYTLTYSADVFGTVTDEFEHAEAGDLMSLWDDDFVELADDVTYASSALETVNVTSPTRVPVVGDILRYNEPEQAYNLMYDSGDAATAFYKYG